MKKTSELSEALKKIILVELSKPQDDETILDEFGVSRVSLPLEQFVTLRQDHRERVLNLTFQEKSLRDFQFLSAKCLMYFLLVILTLTSLRVSHGSINYACLMYGGFSFFVMMLMVFITRSSKLSRMRREADEGYRAALKTLLNRIGEEEPHGGGKAGGAFDSSNVPFDMQG